MYQLVPDLFVLDGAVNTGVLRSGNRALLIDCCDRVTPARLRALGVERVEVVLCTQHRRPNVAGVPLFAEHDAAIIVPSAERYLFEEVTRYWEDAKNRWHLYHHQPGPQVLPANVPVSRGVVGGESITWDGWRIQVLDTPGMTDGAVSYVLEIDGKRIAFCGDVIYGDGQLWDLYSLQKGFGGIRDYHGFLGNRHKLLPTLRSLLRSEIDILIPSHGPVITEPARAIHLLLERLEKLWRNYASISALNYYFPTLLDEVRHDPKRMIAAPTLELPRWVQRVAYTSYALLSESGAAFLIDCGHDLVVDTLQRWLAEERITSVDGCWVTHYHDDHTDSLHRLSAVLGCPIIADEHLADILCHPGRYYLPCISPAPAPLSHATHQGESWSWHEFTLEAYHLPGQTLYHGGLLVRGPDCSLLLIGDSAAPTGLDDYTAGNRVFLGEGVGFRACIDLWRRCQPDLMLNQHQERAFCFSEEQLDYLEAQLVAREELVGELVPWEHANLGIDEWWVRAYPYEQDVSPGASLSIDVQFTNHGSKSALAQVELVPPAGWRAEGCDEVTSLRIPPKTSGVVGQYTSRPDGMVRMGLSVPRTAPPGRYVIPIRVTWNGRYLGQFRHALVNVR